MFGLNPKIFAFRKLIHGNLILRQLLFSQCLRLVDRSDYVMHRHNPGFLRPIRCLLRGGGASERQCTQADD